MGIGIDVKALGIGSAVAFTSAIFFFRLFDRFNLIYGQELIPEIAFIIIITIPGAIAGGYFHSESLLGGALYGMTAIILGVVLPSVLVLILFLGLLGFLGGPPEMVIGFFLVGMTPGFAVVVVGGGIIGGVVGALLRRWRNDIPG